MRIADCRLWIGCWANVKLPAVLLLAAFAACSCESLTGAIPLSYGREQPIVLSVPTGRIGSEREVQDWSDFSLVTSAPTCPRWAVNVGGLAWSLGMTAVLFMPEVQEVLGLDWGMWWYGY